MIQFLLLCWCTKATKQNENPENAKQSKGLKYSGMLMVEIKKKTSMSSINVKKKIKL